MKKFIRKIWTFLEDILGTTHHIEGYPYDLGYSTFMEQQKDKNYILSDKDRNPYIRHTRDYNEWAEGFYDAYKDTVYK